MRKLYFVLLALTLSLVMLTISVVPVMAAKPSEKNGNKPVAWVNWSGSYIFEGERAWSRVSVMKLTDGTTVGHYVVTFGGVEWVNKIYDSYFEESEGKKVAHILTSMTNYDSEGNPYEQYGCTRIEDNGEPGSYVDAFTTFWYIYPNTYPTNWPLETTKGAGYWVQSWAPLNYTAVPDGIWYGENVLYLVNPDPEHFGYHPGTWTQWLPYMTHPLEIQIHITEDCPLGPP